ncbi:MAG: hypothetical protein IT381_18115 [Deltaproteobacteria bacterium]|nr:hypothetical protein [Deltaproteobacteria bacterium]
MAAKKKMMSFPQYNLLMKAVHIAAQVRLPEVAVLSEEDRARQPRARTDFASEAPRLIALAKEVGLELPGLSLEALADDLEFIAELDPVRDAVVDAFEPLLRALDDTLLARRGKAWTTYHAYVATLTKLAETDPQIALKVKPIVEYLSVQKRAKPASNDDSEPKPSPEPVKVPA